MGTNGGRHIPHWSADGCILRSTPPIQGPSAGRAHQHCQETTQGEVAAHLHSMAYCPLVNRRPEAGERQAGGGHSDRVGRWGGGGISQRVQLVYGQMCCRRNRTEVLGRGRPNKLPLQSSSAVLRGLSGGPHAPCRDERAREPQCVAARCIHPVRFGAQRGMSRSRGTTSMSLHRGLRTFGVGGGRGGGRGGHRARLRLLQLLLSPPRHQQDQLETDRWVLVI